MKDSKINDDIDRINRLKKQIERDRNCFINISKCDSKFKKRKKNKY